MKIDYAKIEGVRNKIGDKYDCIFVVGTYYQDGAMLMFPCNHILGISLEAEDKVLVQIKELHSDEVNGFELKQIFFTIEDALNAMEQNYVAFKLDSLSHMYHKLKTSEDLPKDTTERDKKMSDIDLEIKSYEERMKELNGEEK